MTEPNSSSTLKPWTPEADIAFEKWLLANWGSVEQIPPSWQTESVKKAFMAGIGWAFIYYATHGPQYPNNPYPTPSAEHRKNEKSN